MTLVELIVSMMIMTIAMALFTAVAVQMYHAERDTEAVADDQSRVNVAFVRLDREIRYASGISQPTASFVEYLRTDGPTPRCGELWLDAATHELKNRTWTQGATPGSTWTIMVFDVSAAQPFTLLPAAAPFYYQRLGLHFVVSPSGTARSKSMSATFTALNTSLSTSSATVCGEGRQTP